MFKITFQFVGEVGERVLGDKEVTGGRRQRREKDILLLLLLLSKKRRRKKTKSSSGGGGFSPSPLHPIQILKRRNKER